MWISPLHIAFYVALLAGLFDPAVAHGRCGTKSQSKEELDLMQSKINDFRKTRSSMGCKGCITIDTYVYVFRTSDGYGSEVDQTLIDEQMLALNTGFAQTPFKFQLIEASYEEDDFYLLELH
jgi:hypothetical protein